MQAVLAWADQLEHGRERAHANPEDWPFHTTGFFSNLTNQEKITLPFRERAKAEKRAKITFQILFHS